MKKTLFALGLAAAGCLSATASPHVLDWDALAPPTPPLTGYSVGSNNAVVKPDPFGNTYVGTVVSRTTSPYDTDMVITKYNCEGQVLPGWPVLYNYNSANGNDWLVSIDVDNAGNVYAVGTSQLRPRMATVLKYSPLGAKLWDVGMPPSFCGPSSSSIIVKDFSPIGIAVDVQGNVAVAGTLAPVPSTQGNRIAALKFRSYDGWVLGTAALPWLSTASGYTGGDQAVAMTLKPNPQGGIHLFVAGSWWNANQFQWCVTVRFNVSSLVGSYTTPLQQVVYRQAGWMGKVPGISIAYDPTFNRVYTLASAAGGWLIFGYNNDATLTSAAFGSGGMVWFNGTPGFTQNQNYPVAIAIGSAGRVVVLGRTHDPGLSFTDCLLAEWPFNAAGFIAPPLPGFPVTSGFAPSPYYNAHPKALRVDGANNAYVTGYGGKIGGADYLTMRFNPAGGQDWGGAYVPPLATPYAYPSSLALNVAGDVLVTGTATAASGNATKLATVNYDQGPPANDTCTTAKALPGCYPGTVAFNTTFAGTTPFALNLCDPARNKDVWFVWRAPCSGQVDLDTYGSCFDTVLAVYTGPCNSLVLVPGNNCNDNASDGRPIGTVQSYFRFQAVAGTTYYFQVGGNAAAAPNDAGEGRLTLFGPDSTLNVCSATGPFGQFRVYRLNGTPNGNSWRWSVKRPCGVNFEGTANGATGPMLNVATSFAASLNSVGGGCIQAFPMAYSGNPADVALLWVRVRQGGGCPGDYFSLRVGSSTTPYSQLCLVPDVLWGTQMVTTPSSPGQCQFNPTIEEEIVSLADANGNGRPDMLDIGLGTSRDANTNGIPDEVEAGCTNGSVYEMALPAGLNYLANQLDRAGGNTVSNLLAGVPLGSTVYMWNGSGFVANVLDEFDGNWANPAMTLNPGQPFMLNLPEATTLTFAGCPRAPVFHAPVTNGCQYVASAVNAPATYEDIFGQPPTNCLTMQVFEGTNTVTFTYANGGWSPTVPVVGIGQCALVCAITCPPRPTLSAEVAGKNLILSWDAPAFHLQTSTTLGPAATWTNLPSPSPVIIPTTSARGFFRLSKQ